MTVAKVTVSLDPEIADRARRDVASGRSKSVSAWLNEAARERIDGDDLAQVLAEIFVGTGGDPTAEELAEARRRLAEAEQR